MRPPAGAPSAPTPLGGRARKVRPRPAPPDRAPPGPPRLTVLRPSGGPERGQEDGDSTEHGVIGWRVPGASPRDTGEAAAVLDPFARAYAGIDPALVAPLLRWAWYRAFGSNLPSAAALATAEAISQRRSWRRALGM